MTRYLCPKYDSGSFKDITNKQEEPFHIPSEQLAQMQLEDETLAAVIQTAANDKKAEKWVMYEGCLHHIRKQKKSKKKYIQLVLPKALREEVMLAYHDEVLGGHCGNFKTSQKIQQWYWWPEMNKDVQEWVRTCVVCQKHTRNYGPKIGKLAPIIATRPFQIMGMDVLTDLPRTEGGNNCIIVFTDYYTKWVEAYAMSDETALTCATKFMGFYADILHQRELFLIEDQHLWLMYLKK